MRLMASVAIAAMRTAPAPPSTTSPTPPPGGGRAILPLWMLPAGIALAAVAVRLPAFLALRHLSFDDGVYGASAVAMRHGGLPFRDVFSSQGALFLPLVWLFDLLGLRTFDAPRLLAVASGVALVLATWSAARALQSSTGAAALAAGLVATSGSVLWVTGPLTSDGPGLALAAWAVTSALWYRRSPSLRWAIAAGVLLGAALSVKSLLLAAGLPVAWALLPNRRHFAAAVAAAGILSVAVALPWGLGDVWDQAFKYHLEAAGSRTPIRNLRKLISTLGDRDLPIVVAGLLGLVGMWLARSRGSRRDSPTTAAGAALVVAWLAGTSVVLALEHPLWRNHVAHLVPASALLVAVAFDRLRPRAVRGALVAVVLLAVPYHAVHLSEMLWPAPPGPALAAARADLRALPPGAQVISDDPGVVWRAGRRTPDDLVDTSILRIESSRLTAPSLARASVADPVCAVLVWSYRFGDLAALPKLLEDRGYRATARYGGPKVLYVRDACAL
jgi:hypothetical protein